MGGWFDNVIFGKGLNSEKGVTLIELLLAVLLLTMVSAMLYSVLNVSIRFSSRGEKKILEIARERSLLELLHQQVHGAWYDEKKKQVAIMLNEDTLTIITSRTLIFRDLSLVLAVYHYDAREDVLYYTEKIDFYNPDYEENYQPDIDEMIVLMRNVGGLAMELDEETGTFMVDYKGFTYELVPRCRPANG